jgi:HD-like signal output (HDOD) protein
MQNVLGRIDKLPSLPSAYWDLVHAFEGNDIPVRKIADIIETDSAMCGKILQLVNSSCFGTYKTISRIDHAVAYLGTDLVKSLTLTANIFIAMEKVPQLKGFSFQETQAHAVLTARLAKPLASDPQQTSNAFTAALLHDIGYSVLLSCDQERFRKVIEVCSETGRLDFEVELEVFGVTHAEAGAYLLGLWGLPFPLIEAVAYHHKPEASGEQRFDLPSIVSVADALAQSVLKKDFESPLSATLMAHLETLGVASKVPGWKKSAFAEIDITESSLQH